MDNICLCGGAPGYPHSIACPRPLYRATDAQMDQWERDRATIIDRLRAQQDADARVCG